MSLFKKRRQPYYKPYYFQPPMLNKQPWQQPQQPPQQQVKSYYNYIPFSMFKTYPTNEGEGEECADALAQAFVQYRITAEKIYYTESPQVVQLLADMDMENSIKQTRK